MSNWPNYNPLQQNNTQPFPWPQPHTFFGQSTGGISTGGISPGLQMPNSIFFQNWHSTLPSMTSTTFTSSSTSSFPGPSASSSQNVNAMPRTTDSPILTSSPPYPPNWNERYQNTVASLKNYQLFPVDPNTFEYSAIAALLDPASITNVEQIVNPNLWSRFVNTRRDMLKSKCNDLELLSKLDLNETDLLASYQHSLNFDTNSKVLAVPYNDNMALLYHCTRDSGNIENILCQGLDERMGANSGLLGKGIYFSDNPEKSMQYDGCGGVIFIFAVLLGDCLAVDQANFHFVREPEKLPEQKRNVNDLFFDSIVGQPGAGLDNEYVVYNRYQCCPMYVVRYAPGHYTARAHPDSGVYVTSRKYFPPIGWTSSTNYYVTPARVQKTWPFYAHTVFAKMGALVETADENNDENADEKTKKKIDKKPSGLSVKLERLKEFGFNDEEENIETLRKFKFDVDKTISYLSFRN